MPRGKIVTQSVIIKKSHPSVDSRADAIRIAEKHLGKKITTSRETETSYRFRQRKPEDFIKGSFVIFKVSEHISLVRGKLK